MVYNPVEVKINMKKIKTGDNEYYIGNCDMEINLLDTVLKFYPPKDGDRFGVVVINTCKDRKMTNEYSKPGIDEDK